MSQLSVSSPWADQVPFLTQLPGIGPVTAMTLLDAIGDISRFPSAKKLVGYSGLGRIDLLITLTFYLIGAKILIYPQFHWTNQVSPFKIIRWGEMMATGTVIVLLCASALRPLQTPTAPIRTRSIQPYAPVCRRPPQRAARPG